MTLVPVMVIVINHEGHILDGKLGLFNALAKMTRAPFYSHITTK